MNIYAHVREVMKISVSELSQWGFSLSEDSGSRHSLKGSPAKNTVCKRWLILFESINSGYSKRIQLLNNFVILSYLTGVMEFKLSSGLIFFFSGMYAISILHQCMVNSARDSTKLLLVLLLTEFYFLIEYINNCRHISLLPVSSLLNSLY